MKFKYLIPLMLMFVTPAAADRVNAPRCIPEVELKTEAASAGATLVERLQAPDKSIVVVYRHDDHFDVFRFVDGCWLDRWDFLRQNDIDEMKKHFDLERRAD